MAKKHIMSMSIEPELQNLLKVTATERNESVSEFIRKWLMQYPFYAKGVTPVVIDVPNELIGDREKLAAHMAAKSAVVVKTLAV
jgi:hypothetical protein